MFDESNSKVDGDIKTTDQLPLPVGLVFPIIR